MHIETAVDNEFRLHQQIMYHRTLSLRLALEPMEPSQWRTIKTERDTVAADIRRLRNLVNGGRG